MLIVEEINILCAVSKNFAIDEKYSALVKDALDKGLIGERVELYLTAKGQEVMDKHFPEAAVEQKGSEK